MLLDNWGMILGGGSATVVTTAIALLIRRYRRSAGHELQPFHSYVWSSVWLEIKRRLRPALAKQFGVRPYAEVTLAEFPRRLPIPSRGRSSIDIERAYIRLSLSASPDRRINDEALLAANAGSVLVFGEPGSGKSSLTKKLYREELKQAYLKPFRSRLPLHVELGKLPWSEMPEGRQERLQWLWNHLRGLVGRVSRVNEPAFVYDAFANGPGLVLFLDGLDEVASDKLKAVEALIGELISSLRLSSPKTTVVVTARTQLRGLLNRDFVNGFTEVLTVTPFTPADVFAFLRRWEYPLERRLAETHRVFEHLRRNVTLFAMCTNPLVLSMYVAEDEFHSNQAGSTVRLADTRVRFYDQVVGELLYFRREDQRPDSEPVGSQLLVTREDLLGRIALDHLLESDDPANVISLARAARIAQDHWDSPSVEAASRELSKLAVETGLVTVQQEGHSLQFIHLSICEYLAGKELAERNEEQLDALLDRIATGGPEARRLWETAVFAVALSKRDPRARALRRLTEQNVATDLILRIFREVQTYDLPDFETAVKAATAEISAHAVEDWDNEWIDRVRLLLSCLSDAHRLAAVRQPVSIPTVSTWLDFLVGSDGARFTKVFDLYLAASPAEALRLAGELGVRERLFAEPERIVSAMEHPDLIALAMKMVMDGAPDMGLWADALAEAGLRIELVAQTLFEEKIPAPLRKLADPVAERHAWHRFGPAADTFYGAVMAVATSRVAPVAQDAGPTLVGRVEVVSHVRPKQMDRGVAFDAVLGYITVVAASAALALTVARRIDMSYLTLGAMTLGGLITLRALSIRLVGGRNVWQTSTKAELLGLERLDHPAFDPPQVFLARFSRSGVRLYAGRDDLEAALTVDVETISRSLPVWTLIARRTDGKSAMSGRESYVTNLMNHATLVQAVNIMRKAGPVWCIPVQVRQTISLLPARRDLLAD